MGYNEECYWRFWRIWVWKKSARATIKRTILIYILDKNIISHIIKNRDFSLIDKFETIPKEHRIGVSSISMAELYYGVRKKDSRN